MNCKKGFTVFISFLIIISGFFVDFQKVFADGYPADLSVDVIDDEIIISSADTDFLSALANGDNAQVYLERTTDVYHRAGFEKDEMIYEPEQNRVRISADSVRNQRVASGIYDFHISPNDGTYIGTIITKAITTSIKNIVVDPTVSFEQAKGLIISSDDTDFLNSLANGSTSNIHLRNTEEKKDKVYDSSVINVGEGNVYIKTADVINKEGFVNQKDYKVRIYADGYEEWDINVFVNITVVPPKVTFDYSQIDNSKTNTVSIDFGSAVSKPDTFVTDGYNFEGWYLNGSLYDFSSAVESDITLVGKWIEKSTDQGKNIMPNYDSDEDKKAVADQAEDTMVDLQEVAQEIEVSEEISQKAVSAETLQNLGLTDESKVKVVVETSLNMSIESVTNGSDGKISEFVIDIEPVYIIKAINKEDATKDPVVLQGATELTVNKAVKVRIYLPDSFKEGDRVWVKHKGIVLTDADGAIAAKDEKGVYVEVTNPDGFSPFQVSKSKLTPDTDTLAPVPEKKERSSSETTAYKIPKTGIDRIS